MNHSQKLKEIQEAQKQASNQIRREVDKVGVVLVDQLDHCGLQDSKIFLYASRINTTHERMRGKKKKKEIDQPNRLPLPCLFHIDSDFTQPRSSFKVFIGTRRRASATKPSTVKTGERKISGRKQYFEFWGKDPS